MFTRRQGFFRQIIALYRQNIKVYTYTYSTVHFIRKWFTFALFRIITRNLFLINTAESRIDSYSEFRILLKVEDENLSVYGIYSTYHRCNQGFYTSGSASRRILVRSGRETSTGCYLTEMSVLLKSIQLFLMFLLQLTSLLLLSTLLLPMFLLLLVTLLFPCSCYCWWPCFCCLPCCAHVPADVRIRAYTVILLMLEFYGAGVPAVDALPTVMRAPVVICVPSVSLLASPMFLTLTFLT